jgi:hypothetical protein
MLDFNQHPQLNDGKYKYIRAVIWTERKGKRTISGLLLHGRLETKLMSSCLSNSYVRIDVIQMQMFNFKQMLFTSNWIFRIRKDVESTKYLRKINDVTNIELMRVQKQMHQNNMGAAGCLTACLCLLSVVTIIHVALWAVMLIIWQV